MSIEKEILLFISKDQVFSLFENKEGALTPDLLLSYHMR